MTPLSGLKVVELARILAGPWAGQTLAGLGADVIKVEAPEGDDTRRWGPPFLDHASGKAAAYFHGTNRGKRSVALNLMNTDDARVLRALIADADVLIENFKVGALDRMGFGPAAMAELNPRLVHCSITGFGQDGPYAGRAGYDVMIQAMSGLMSITGEADGPPQKVGVAVADIATGLYATIGILSALRERDRTGRGQHLDLSLLDCAVALTANQAMNYLATGDAPGRLGNGHPNLVPYQAFPTSDGWAVIAVGNEAQYRRFCQVIGEAELGTDPAWATNADRVAGRNVLVPRIAAATGRMTRDALLSGCEAAGVPAGPINTLHDVFADPHVAERGLSAPADGLPGVAVPIRRAGAGPTAAGRAPGLDEHGDEIRARQSF